MGSGGRVGGLGVGSGKLLSLRQIVFASNRLRIKSSCTLRHFSQMNILGKWVFGTNGHVETETNGHLRKWAFLGKWALWDRCALGQVGIGGKWALGENEHQEKILPEQTGICGK